jgi:ketosteroid isomerase-like protein
MTNSEKLKEIIRSTYAARVGGDIDGTMAAFADHVTFEFNGGRTGLPGMTGPIKGKPSVRNAIQNLIDNFLFSDWKEVSSIVDGDKAALHWRVRVTFVPNGRSDTFDVIDLITFRGGKIVDFRQSTDTAKIKSMVAG